MGSCISGGKPNQSQQEKIKAVLSTQAKEFSHVKSGTINYYKEHRFELDELMRQVRKTSSQSMGYLYSLERNGGKYCMNETKYANTDGHDAGYIYNMWLIDGPIAPKSKPAPTGPYGSSSYQSPAETAPYPPPPPGGSYGYGS
jgi:hypothetical protein